MMSMLQFLPILLQKFQRRKQTLESLYYLYSKMKLNIQHNNSIQQQQHRPESPEPERNPEPCRVNRTEPEL